MLRQLPHNLFIALEAIYQNKFRAFLTSLGILFGVASVIAMLAIGQGAQQEILEQLKLLGTNNIIITPVIEKEEGRVDEEDAEDKKEQERRFSPGLTLQDAKNIEYTIPQVEHVSPEVVYDVTAVRAGLKRSLKFIGVTPYYFSTSNFILDRGNMFSEYQMENALPVCIIGSDVRTRFFPGVDPVGLRIKVGQMWLTVIGVLKERGVAESHIQHLGLRDYDMDIYTPISTILLRYKNRARITGDDILKEARRQQNGESGAVRSNYHQLDRLVVRVSGTEYMKPVSEVIARLLERRHNQVVDFEVIVPEILLEQEQRTKSIFNIVLGAIASISLVVGGIGIMNIMLASVMEWIREIGIRLAVGATERDIVLQFLAEAIAISMTGGLVGILVGFLLSSGIEHFTGILTIVSPWSVAVSFLVSITVGLVFGIFPARKAAAQDPIVSLRYE